MRVRWTMRPQLAIVIILLVTLLGCGSPDLREKFRNILEYREIVRTLEQPITVTHVDVFPNVAGSLAFTLSDARGQELSFCVQAVLAGHGSGGRHKVFGVGLIHIGDRNPVWDKSVPVGPDSEMEDELLALMREWIRKRFPDWTDSTVVRHVPRRENGAVNDTTAAVYFRSAIRLVEHRRVVLGAARYPG
jgi:hypothetical protein